MAETVKEFLVSLGFKIDDVGRTRFETVLKGVTQNFIKLSTVAEGAALAVVGFSSKIASGLDELYFAANRTNTTVAGIKAVGYAATQTGLNAQQSMAALSSLANFISNNPGGEAYLNRLGVSTRNASGQLRDMSSIFIGVGQQLNRMPIYRAQQFGEMFGMDRNMILAMRSGFSTFTNEYRGMMQKTGFDAEKSAKKSHLFMTSMRQLAGVLGILRDKIGSNLAAGLTATLQNFTKQILDNFPKIEKTITQLIKVIVWFTGIMGQVTYRVSQIVIGIIEWWQNLDHSSKKLILTLGGLVAAWRLLNSTFLFSPIGMITALAGAIFLLWDDFKTWKEGGNSLIDWQKWEPAIEQAKAAISWLVEHISKLVDLVGGWQNVFYTLATFMATKWTINMLSSIGKVAAALTTLMKFNGKTIKITLLVGLLSWLNSFSKKWDPWREAEKKEAKEMKELGINSYDEYVKKKYHMKLKEGYSLENFNIIQSTFHQLKKFFSSNEPRGIRNNNPGNLRYVGQTGASSDGGFAVYANAYDGMLAMANQLVRYFDGKTTGKPLRTINDIIKTWAPSGENDTTNYVEQISKKMGLDPSILINIKNPEVLAKLMNHMITVENGRNPYSQAMISQAATQALGATINQTNTYHIYGNSAHQIASDVEKRQLSSNATAYRYSYSGAH